MLGCCFFCVCVCWQLSSCQIYNVEKRIQEDHLQQLALFSEYGRMALSKQQEITAGGGVEEDAEGAEDALTAGVDLGKYASPSIKGGESVSASAVGFAAKARANAEARRTATAGWGAADSGAGGAAQGGGGVTEVVGVDGEPGSGVSQDWVERPFQRLEFLVRDWQVRFFVKAWECGGESDATV